jgi:membrane protein DedA with SNARE-associated domain
VVRLGGRPLVERMARALRIPLGYLDRTEVFFRRWGTAAVFIGRVIPGVRVLITIPAGLARMRYPVFAAVTFAGAYLWCTILLGVGYLFGHEWPLMSASLYEFAPYLLGAGLLVVAAGGVWVYWTQTHKFLRSTPMSSLE